MDYLLLILSVLLPSFWIYFKADIPAKFNKVLLAFSGAYLLGISFMHLLPEVYEVQHKLVGVFIVIGFLVQLLLEYISQGVEHGHAHHATSFGKYFPLLLLGSLMLHSITEIIPVAYEQTTHNHEHSHTSNLLWGFVLHKIPVALTLTGILIKSKVSKLMQLICICLFAISAPAALYWTINIAPSYELPENFFALASALSIGIILHISTTILFESNQGHKFNLVKFVSVITGLAAAYLLVG